MCYTIQTNQVAVRRVCRHWTRQKHSNQHNVIILVELLSQMCIVDWFAYCCHGNINVNLVLDPGSDHVLQQHCPAILMHVWQRLFECCTSFTATSTSTQRGCCTSFTATSTSTQRGCCKPPYRPILSDPSPHLELASATFPSKVWFIHNSGRCPCPDTWMELL